MRIVWWMIWREWRLFWADRQGLLVTLAVPVLLGIFFGMLTDSKGTTPPIELLVVDQDVTASSKALVAELDGLKMIRVRAVTLEVARDELQKGEAPAALVLPRGTGEVMSVMSLINGESVQGQLLHDPSRQVETGILGGLIQRAVMQSVMSTVSDEAKLRRVLNDTLSELRDSLGEAAPEHLRRTLNASLDSVEAWSLHAEEEQGQDQESAIAFKMPLELVRESVSAAGASSGYNGYSHSFVGMLCIFILMMGMDRSKGLIKERQQGSLVRLRVVPGRPWVVLCGFGLGIAVVSALVIIVVLAFGIAGFGIEVKGSPVGLALMVLSLSLLSGGFALFLAGLGRTEAQINGLGSAFVLLLCFLGGAMFPAFLFPEALQSVVPATPLWWVNEGFAGVTWRGLGLEHSLTRAGVTTAFALAFGFIGVRRFRFT